MEDAFDAHLDADGVSFDGSDARLLATIAETGSVSGAAESLGRSRARCLARLRELEDALGPLVERRRGGSDGGGSELTAAARDVLGRFDRLQATLSGTADVPETVLSGIVTHVEGELCSVETDAGTIRAVATESVRTVEKAVTVSVRADAVTLHDPSDTPDESATSARNRLSGTVEGVKRGDAVATVSVSVGLSTPLRAFVTVESVRRLSLEPGTSVVASWKATATRATSTAVEPQ
ncbi:LysR family transcriptional regulator [Halogeometricum borinquense]|uniref:LysR family transcriptional regulator n=1 Tax=Halogeometricum borinquense TaxID=60847 RepID=A0A6C0UKD1_9EURY|nr:TOBE domain-containing protein [Halogeometricum borinquense]QIB75925.1 LysR family transcriptional regulator [Halogeometricum borinquense]QIQ75493.1 LysR family transcriptional regulator [Halogeometricum borinquense]